MINLMRKTWIRINLKMRKLLGLPIRITDFDYGVPDPAIQELDRQAWSKFFAQE